jgi:hypothetical protein
MPDAAPAPITPTELANMDAAQITSGLRDGRISGFAKFDAIDRLGTLLRGQEAAPKPVAPADFTKRAEIPTASLELAQTPDEASRAAEAEREAFTRPANLPTDFIVPGESKLPPEVRTVNRELTESMHAAGVPVAVGNLVLNQANFVAQQISQMSDAERDERAEFVKAEMQRQWGAEYNARVTAIKTYLQAAAQRAEASGQPKLKQMLTAAPELLEDPATLNMLWNAAKHSAQR